MYSDKNHKYKTLYYKNNNNISIYKTYSIFIYNAKFIKYTYKQNKYLKKTCIDYSIDNTFLIYITNDINIILNLNN